MKLQKMNNGVVINFIKFIGLLAMVILSQACDKASTEAVVQESEANKTPLWLSFGAA